MSGGRDDDLAVEVPMATCIGGERLGWEIDLPLVHIDAVPDAAAAIAPLNERRHGAAVATDHPFEPLAYEDGWSDRRVLDLGAEADRVGSGVAPQGLRFGRGRLFVDLSRGASLAKFREHLRVGLRHLRTQESALDRRYVRSGLGEATGIVLAPCHTGNGVDGVPAGAAVVDDLHVADLVASFGEPSLKIAAARASVSMEVCP